MRATATLIKRSKLLRHQSGAVLAVCLVFLLIITLIAVSSMRDTLLEEKMAGNTRDRNLAFQAAESAAREAEIFVEGLVSLGDFDVTAGLYGLNSTEPSYAHAATWDDEANYVEANSDYGAYLAPRYLIKQFTTMVGTEGAMNMSGYGGNKGTGDVTVFKITARGTGGSADSAEVIIRSQFGRRF
ncbi:MAG: hypothetical protein IID58_08370 [Proteobacteria bacterium]|nr:hypothetical protein [Pseudomonadota bacterium]